MLALVFAFNKFRSYLVSKKVLIDHAVISKLFNKKDSKGRLILCSFLKKLTLRSMAERVLRIKLSIICPG